MRETTALGAAIAAGLAVGLWKNFTELRDINRAGGAVFEPQISKAESAESFATWEKAVSMSKGWVGKGTPQTQPQEQDQEQKKSEATVTKQEPLERTLLAKDGFQVSGLKTAVKGGGVPPSKGLFSVSGDLDGADEEDLLLELRRIEILQRLKSLRRVKAACSLI